MCHVPVEFCDSSRGCGDPGGGEPSRPMLPDESSSVEVVDVDCRFTV